MQSRFNKEKKMNAPFNRHALVAVMHNASNLREDENGCNSFDKNNKNTLCSYNFHLHSSLVVSLLVPQI